MFSLVSVFIIAQTEKNKWFVCMVLLYMKAGISICLSTSELAFVILKIKVRYMKQ